MEEKHLFYNVSALDKHPSHLDVRLCLAENNLKYSAFPISVLLINSGQYPNEDELPPNSVKAKTDYASNKISYCIISNLREQSFPQTRGSLVLIDAAFKSNWAGVHWRIHSGSVAGVKYD